MRVVFIGAGELVVFSAQTLLERGHEVVIIERDRETIDALSDEVAAGFLHGDGTRPSILEEAGPEQTDALFCLTDSDQANILAALVGRSLGFARTIVKIEDAQFESICLELGLQDVTLPSRMFGRYLSDLVEGRDVVELSNKIKHDARLFSFIAGDDDAGPAGELDLPERSRAICLYRDGKFDLIDAETRIKKDDEVVILTAAEQMETLRERWEPQGMR